MCEDREENITGQFAFSVNFTVPAMLAEDVAVYFAFIGGLVARHTVVWQDFLDMNNPDGMSRLPPADLVYARVCRSGSHLSLFLHLPFFHLEC